MMVWEEKPPTIPWPHKSSINTVCFKTVVKKAHAVKFLKPAAVD